MSLYQITVEILLFSTAELFYDRRKKLPFFVSKTLLSNVIHSTFMHPAT